MPAAKTAPARKATPKTPAAAPVAKKAPAAKKAAPAVKKVAPAAKKAPVAAPASEKAAKAPKVKLVRDSFTMPAGDFALIDTLKERALGFRRPTKKSELLRAGLQALAALSPAQLETVLGSLEPLKTGRPKKAA